MSEDWYETEEGIVKRLAQFHPHYYEFGDPYRLLADIVCALEHDQDLATKLDTALSNREWTDEHESR
jgi:hypothetical protein